METNYIKCGDCLDLMKELPDKSIDMILCDLPYGVTQNEKDKPIDLTLLWNQYKRIIKESGAIILFCQGGYYIDLVNSNRKWFKYDIVWDKVLTSNFLNAKKMPLRQHELIAVFYNKPPTYNPQFTQGKPLHSKGTSYKAKESINNNYGDFATIEDVRKGSTDKYPTSIIRFAKPHSSVAKHRTEKPIALLAFEICKPYNLVSPVYSRGGFRGGCWFCVKQCMADLWELWKFYPNYFNVLLELEKDSFNTFKPTITLLGLKERFEKGNIPKRCKEFMANQPFNKE